MKDNFYIPKLNKIITIEYDYNKETSMGTCNIYDESKLLKTITNYKCGQLYYIVIKAYTELIELLYEDVEDYDILAIDHQDDIVKLLTSKYELLDKKERFDEIDPSIGCIDRIIFIDNKIIKLSTGVEQIYSEKLKKHCNIETSANISILKKL